LLEGRKRAVAMAASGTLRRFAAPHQSDSSWG